MLEFNLLQKIMLWLVPTIFAITLHEAAHGLAAYYLGDATAKAHGRLTLNPLKHVDVLGTLIIPITLYLTSGYIFGWAKAVPVNYRNFKQPRRDAALVACAGPLSNLLMAALWVLSVKLGMSLNDAQNIYGNVFFYMGLMGVGINVFLCVLNLMPIPPLDGSRVLAACLSPRWRWQFDKLEPYGFLILLALLTTGILSHITQPFIAFLQSWLLQGISLVNQ